MISNIILIISIILTLFIFLQLIIIYLINKKKKANLTGSELVLKLLDNESTINLIEIKESKFSKYNIKRKMVKLSSKTYDSSNYFNLAVASILSGYSLIDNKLLNYLSYIFKELKFISFSPLVTVIASLLTSNIGDAKICMFILIPVAIYQYIINIINIESITKVKSKDDNINKILNKFILTSKLSFIITLIEIVRLSVIILNM